MSSLRLARFILPLSLVVASAFAGESEEGFTALTDGKTFNGWKSALENKDTWKIEDGAFVSRGQRCHLFYVGDEKPFKNFILRVEVMTEPGANGGIYFHTKYQDKSWPTAGFESQVNNTQSDWKKTGSIYGIANIGVAVPQDNVWWTQEIAVQGSVVTVSIDGKKVVEYDEPPGAVAGQEFERKLGAGTFALQAHDPKSIVHYRNIRVKRLPE